MTGKDLIKDILIIVLILGLVGLGTYHLINPQVIYQEKLIEENKAILSTETTGIYENLYNADEMFFRYWIYNYGNSEAINVKARCKLFDLNDKLISTTQEDVGNIASHSAWFGESITKNIDTGNDTISYICYIESCDNCEILYKNIPELIKFYEKE